MCEGGVWRVGPTSILLTRPCVGGTANPQTRYRTHLLFADQVARTYSFGDQALLKVNEAIKDALDPNGILAPGRSGIWPKRWRGQGWELGVGDVDMKRIGPRL